MRNAGIKITLFYILVSLIWITFSDELLFLFHERLPVETLHTIGSVKGYAFVLCTGIALYFMVRNNERRITDNERHYRNMYESNPNPMWVFDVNTLRFTSVNNAAIVTYGYSREEFLQMTVLDIRPPDERERLLNIINSDHTQYQKSGIWRHVKKDGTEILVTITTTMIKSKGESRMFVMANDTTESTLYKTRLSQLNEELAAEKRKLEQTQLRAKVAGWEFYPETQKLVWTDQLYEITGIEKRDNREAFDIYIEHIYADDRPRMIQGMERLIKEGKQLNEIHRIYRINGETGFVHQVADIEREEGKPLKVVGTIQDITELKLIEQDRNKYLSNFEDTLNTINDAFFALNSNMEITRINEAFSKLTGKDNAIIGKHFLSVFGGSVNVNFYSAYQRAIKEKQISKLEDFSNYLQKWISMKVYPTDEGAVIYFSDITESRLKDLQLKEAVERYDLVARATQDVIYDFDMVHDRLIYNTSLTQLIKRPFDKIEYHLDWWRSLIHPDDLPGVISSQKKVIREKRTNWECEYRVDVGDGVYKYIMDQGYLIFNDDHEPVRLIGAIRDIDTLKRTHEENSRLAGIITRVNNMIVVTDQNGRVTWVNRAFENIIGYTLEDIEGKKPREFFNGPETNLKAVEEIKQRKRKRETFAIDLVNHGKGGQPIWVTAEFTPMYDEGRYLGYIAVYTDISIKKAQEQEIKHQNNMLRGVAWMASHELRRPVATILGLLYLIKLAEDDKEKEELVALIDKCANELDEIVHQMNGKIYAEDTYQHGN